MKLYRVFLTIAAILTAGIFSAAAQSSNSVATAPTYVPDISHQNDPLPDGVITFDSAMKSLDVIEGQDFAKFTFTFTNVSPNIVTVLDVHPSCGCTTAELPPRPWQIPPGTTGSFTLSINLAGKHGVLPKSATFTTDKGKRELYIRVNIAPAPVVKMTDEQKAAGIAAAKVDRQAIFKGDCASCHVKNFSGIMGEQLFKNACAICHQAENRATMVPDLAQLKVPTSEEFWRTWATFGKPGTLMPAFADSQGGPLNDMQIASLAQYLDHIYPSKVAPAGQ